jgi:hypothetical protein
VAAIDERRSCYKPLNSLNNPLVWWRLLHNVGTFDPRAKVGPWHGRRRE